MAPSKLYPRWDFNTEVNIWAMAGSWVGAFVAALGLISVYIQLKAYFTNRNQRQWQLIRRISGQYADLVEPVFKNKGIVEGVAPSFAGWIQAVYKRNQTLAMTQNDRRIAGTSSWSRFFAQAGVKPQTLLGFGGPDAKFYAVITGEAKSRPPPKADLIVEESSCAYGFTPSEFVALLVISGFSPTQLTRVGTSITFLGSMALGEHTPFSLQAKFDPHPGALVISEPELHDHGECMVPVKRCIDYAVGLIPIPSRGGPLNFVVIPRLQREISEESEDKVWKLWKTQPTMGQLHGIRINFERLVYISGADVIPYNVNTTNATIYFERVMSTIAPDIQFSLFTIQAGLLSLFALAALDAWPVLPVLQRHFVQAFLPLLQPFVGTRAETVELLQKKLLDATDLKPTSGWTSVEEQALELGQVGDVGTEHFASSASTSSTYFKSMMLVFDICGEELEPVRNGLAAASVWEVILRREADAVHKEKVISGILKFLADGHEEIETPAAWAVTVYATFLYGWLHDYLDVDVDFENGLRRRIFLG